jgi:hypothetical protein
VAAKKRKSGPSSQTVRQTTLSPEGFREPFSLEEVPWKRLPGSTAFKRLGAYGGGSAVGVGKRGICSETELRKFTRGLYAFRSGRNGMARSSRSGSGRRPLPWSSSAWETMSFRL